MSQEAKEAPVVDRVPRETVALLDRLLGLARLSNYDVHKVVQKPTGDREVQRSVGAATAAQGS